MGSRGQSARRSKLINAAAGAGECAATREAKPGYQSHRLYYIEKQIVLYLPVEDIWSSDSCWPFHFAAVCLY